MNPDEVRIVLDSYKKLIKKAAATEYIEKARKLLWKNSAGNGLCYYALRVHSINLLTNEMMELVEKYNGCTSTYLCPTPGDQYTLVDTIKVMNRRVEIVEDWLLNHLK